MRIIIENTYLFFVTCLFLIFGYMLSFNMILNYDLITDSKLILIFLYFICLLISGMRITKVSKFNLIIFILWELLIISIFLSYLTNLEYYYAFTSLILLLMPLGIYVHNLKYKIHLISLTAIITFIPFLWDRIGETSNELGMNLAMVGILVVNFIVSEKKRSEEKEIKSVLLIIVFLVITFLIFLTESRSALLAFIIIIFINSIYIVIKENKSKLILLLPTGIIFSLIYILLFDNNILASIFNLFTDKWDGARDISLLSGRERIWFNVLNSDISILGNGMNYFSLKFGIDDAHNSFIQVFGQFGLLSFIFYLMIVILILIKITKVRNKIIYINFFAGYLTISIFEDLFFASSRFFSITLLFFVYSFMLLNEDIIPQKIRKIEGDKI